MNYLFFQVNTRLLVHILGQCNCKILRHYFEVIFDSLKQQSPIALAAKVAKKIQSEEERNKQLKEG